MRRIRGPEGEGGGAGGVFVQAGGEDLCRCGKCRGPWAAVLVRMVTRCCSCHWRKGIVQRTIFGEAEVLRRDPVAEMNRCPGD